MSPSDDNWKRLPDRRLVLRQSADLQTREIVKGPGLPLEVVSKLLTPATEEEEHLENQTIFAVGGEEVILDQRMHCKAEAVSVPEVDGLLAIRGLLSEGEAARLLSVAEAAGFDEALGLPTSVLLARQPLCRALFNRLQPALRRRYPGALGLNARWRVYQYSVGDTFEPHIDGSWPCSGLVSELGSNSGEQEGSN